MSLKKKKKKKKKREREKRKKKEIQQHMVELIEKVKECIDYRKLGAWGK